MSENLNISKEINNNKNLDLYTKSPSIIENKDLNKSLSDSSIQSYNIYTNLIPGKKNEIERKQIFKKENFKLLNPNFLIKREKNMNQNNFMFTTQNLNNFSLKNIREKIRELKETSLGNNLKSERYLIKNNNYNEKNELRTKKSTSVLMTKMDRMKYENIISIDNSNMLQKKAKKMLNNLKSNKIKKDDDIQDFKNQFENYKKKSLFGIVDFQKKFKNNFTTPKHIRYNHFFNNKNFDFVSLRTNSNKNRKIQFSNVLF